MYSASASSSLHLSRIWFKLAYLLGSVQGTVATEDVTLGTIQVVSQTFGTIIIRFSRYQSILIPSYSISQ